MVEKDTSLVAGGWDFFVAVAKLVPLLISHFSLPVYFYPSSDQQIRHKQPRLLPTDWGLKIREEVFDVVLNPLSQLGSMFISIGFAPYTVQERFCQVITFPGRKPLHPLFHCRYQKCQANHIPCARLRVRLSLVVVIEILHVAPGIESILIVFPDFHRQTRCAWQLAGRQWVQIERFFMAALPGIRTGSPENEYRRLR